MTDRPTDRPTLLPIELLSQLKIVITFVFGLILGSLGPKWAIVESLDKTQKLFLAAIAAL